MTRGASFLIRDTRSFPKNTNNYREEIEKKENDEKTCKTFLLKLYNTVKRNVQ